MNIKLHFVFLFFLLTTVYAQAQVPANDLCENAAPISCGDVVTGSTVEATETGEITDFCGTGEGSAGVWYLFAGTGDNVTVSLCNSDFDTKIQVFSGNCFSTTCVAGDDDGCGVQSQVTFTSDASTNYLIYVFGFGTATGEYELEITCTPPPPPTVNDLCEDALPIACDETVTGITDGSTSDGAPTGLCGTTAGAPGNWYEFQGTGDLVTASLCTGTNYDSKIQIYSGNCFSLSCVAGNDDFCGLQSEVTFLSDASTTYYVYVFGFGAATGTYTLTLSCLAPPPPPDNDECDGAIEALVNQDDSCDLITSGTLAGATESGIDNTCPGIANDDVWFEFTATATTLIIQVLNIQGDPTNVNHAIFEGPDCGSLTNILCSDPNQSLAQNLTIGETYFVRIYSSIIDPFVSTTFDLCISQLPDPPINDECADAIPVPVNQDETCTLVTAGGLGGATDSNLVNPCGGFADDDVWFSFVADNSIHIVELLNIQGAPTDIVFGVYEDPCTAPVNVGCSTGQDAFLSGLTVGTTYYIRVYTAGATPVNTTTFDVCVRQIPPPPVNDLCEDAIPIVCGENLTGSTVDSTGVGAPAAICGTTAGAPGNWYSFTGTGDIVELGLCGSSFDTKIQVYSGACDALVCIGGNDDSCGLQSEVAFLSEVGTEYLIYVFGFGTSEGEYTFLATCSPPPPPPVNDDCDEAISVEVNDDNSCTLFTPGTIAGATSSSVPNTCNGSADNDVWFSFVATSMDHSISFININGSTANLNHTVYEGDDCGTFTQLYCSDDNQSNANNLTIGNTYFVRVYSFSSNPLENTSFDVCVNTILPPSDCLDAMPFCSQDGLIFPNVTGGDSADPSIDYECLFTQPNPSWFFLQIDQTGDLAFEIVQNTTFDNAGNPTGTPLDVDFIAWGPFTSVEEGCGDLNPSTSIDCSFSAAPVENFTITGATAGDIYILLITNFDGDPGFISLQQTNFGESDGGSTDCTILSPCTVEIDQDDNQTLCDTEELILTTTVSAEVDTFQWFENGVLLAGETNPTLTVDQTGVYRVEVNGMDCDTIVFDEIAVTFVSCDPDCTDAVFFEDFGTGVGVVTDPFVTIPFGGGLDLLEGTYGVSNTLVGLNPFWHFDLEDHTSLDVDGRMLVINADSDDAVSELYRRPVTIEANTDYRFGFWLATVYDVTTNICTENGGLGFPANVDYRIETPGGTLIALGTTGDVPNTVEPIWLEFGLDFNSGTNTDIVFVLSDNAGGVCGNDFAIDDIGFYFEGEAPVIVAPEDISVCDDGVATFDLTSQNDIILDGLNAADFNFLYFTSEQDALSGNNSIGTPDAYDNISNPETIWVRVERQNQPSCFSIISFNIFLEEQIDLGVEILSLYELCSNEDFPAIDGTPTNPNLNPDDFTYTWTDAGGNTVADTAIFIPTQGGVYTLTVGEDICGVTEFITEVVVFEAPVIDLGPVQTFCEGEEAFEIIPVITGDLTGVTYLWSTGETTPTIIVNETGNYSLTINVGLCTVSNSLDVNFLDNPQVSLGEDFKSCPGEVTLTTTILNQEEGVTYTYVWFDADGNEISGETQSTYVATIDANTLGSVNYSVIVLNGTCEGTDDVDISLYDIDNCMISQGISPNNDNLNDSLDLEFLADRSGIENLKIFNRLGTLVFDRNNYINEWRGQTTDEEDLPTGTYYYVIVFDNEDVEYGLETAGFIYLNREP